MRTVDRLIYINYSANRDTFPEIAVGHWSGIYGDRVKDLEEKYQADKQVVA